MEYLWKSIISVHDVDLLESKGIKQFYFEAVKLLLLLLLQVTNKK